MLDLGEHKPHIYGKLAHCYFKAWEFEKSKKIYHILISIDDSDPNPYFNLGQVFIKDKQIDSAKFYIKKSIEIQKPSFYREYRSLANIAREQEDLKTAIKYYRLAAEEKPEDIAAAYQVCALADQLYKDPKLKLSLYENFIAKFENGRNSFFSNIAAKRIRELKQEIHFTDN